MPFSDKENSTDAIVTARPTGTIAGLETNAIAGIAVQADLKRPPILPRILVFVVLLIGAIAGFAYFTIHRRAPEIAISSIAVLPLDNLSDDRSEAYFADGMTDAVIRDLTEIGELRVVARTTSMHYKGSKKPLPEIARELNVDAVVGGTVQRVGDQVLVRAQLIHAATDVRLWVKEYRGDVKNVLDLQSEIARDIASEVLGKKARKF